jgi:hypothetical protein
MRRRFVPALTDKIGKAVILREGRGQCKKTRTWNSANKLPMKKTLRN